MGTHSLLSTLKNNDYAAFKNNFTKYGNKSLNHRIGENRFFFFFNDLAILTFIPKLRFTLTTK